MSVPNFSRTHKGSVSLGPVSGTEVPGLNPVPGVRRVCAHLEFGEAAHYDGRGNPLSTVR